jgi:hypothetical protein
VSRPLAELYDLVQPLGEELGQVEKAHPRKFDAGVFSAQLAVRTLSSVFNEEGFSLTTKVILALREIEAALPQGQGKPPLDRARGLFRQIRGPLVHWDVAAVDRNNLNRHLGMGVNAPEEVKPPQPSRRTRCAADLALRLLSPLDRQRFREEWAAEIADLPRRDQAPHAFRLLIRSWSLRRELGDKPARNPREVLLVVGVAIPGADALAALCGRNWPAAVVGGVDHGFDVGS